MQPRFRPFALLAIAVCLSVAAPTAQTATAPPPAAAPAAAALKLTTPEQFFGHQHRRRLLPANYTQFAEYWRKLDAESDRMVVQRSARPPRAARS